MVKIKTKQNLKKKFLIFLISLNINLVLTIMKILYDKLFQHKFKVQIYTQSAII